MHTRFKTACSATNRKMTTEIQELVERRTEELEEETGLGETFLAPGRRGKFRKAEAVHLSAATARDRGAAYALRLRIDAVPALLAPPRDAPAGLIWAPDSSTTTDLVAIRAK